MSRPERDALAFEGAKLLLEFILVADAIVSFFLGWIGADIGEQVIHGIQKFFLVLSQALTHFAMLVAEVCILKPVIELPKIGRLLVYISINS